MQRRPAYHVLLHYVILYVLISVVVWAYSNSFHGPFIFDDKPALWGNPTLRKLNWHIFTPPSANGTTVGGRPLLNASLAVDYAIGQMNVFSYHVTNLVIHIFAVLALYGVIRRTLETYPMFGYKEDETPSVDPILFAGCAALLWGLHPLNTESVTYVVQRAESGAALFYLLCLYCFIRSYGSARPTLWLTLSILSVLVGATVKETVCTAPFVIILFDRAFAAGSFKEAWQRHWRYYLCFVLVWVEIYGLIQMTGGDRGGSIGFGVSGAWWKYSLTQFEAITRYIGSSFWPRELVFNYGVIPTPSITDSTFIPYVLIVLAFLSVTVWAVIKKPGIGFLAATFFIILGPTSSVIPGPSQMIVDHRTYLSEACIVVLVVTAAYSFLGRFAFIVCTLIAGVFGIFTYQRNAEYRSEKALWTTVTERWPQNAEAWNDLGAAYYAEKDYPAAVNACLEALKRNKDLAAAYYNLAEAYNGAGERVEAEKAYELAILKRPKFAEAHNNLGVIYLAEGRSKDALKEFQTAVGLADTYIEAIENLGITFQNQHDYDEAAKWFRRALEVNPYSSNGHNGLADIALTKGQDEVALKEYMASYALVKNNPAVLASIGALQLKREHPVEAIPYFERALQLDNHRFDAALNIGKAFLLIGHNQQAVQAYRIAIKINPSSPAAHYDCANALGICGLPEEAIAELKTTLALDPKFSDAAQKLDKLQHPKLAF